MRTLRIITLAAFGSALLAACTPAASTTDPTSAPHASTVGSIGIVTHAPASSATPDASGGGAEPSVTPTSDVAASEDSDDSFAEGLSDSTQDQVDALCVKVSSWWESARHTSRKEWVDAGMYVYASSYVLNEYDDATFDALVAEDWSDYQVDPYLTEYATPACILYRTSGNEVEAVTFTFLLADPPTPEAMLYQRSGTISSARAAADASVG